VIYAFLTWIQVSLLVPSALTELHSASILLLICVIGTDSADNGLMKVPLQILGSFAPYILI